MITGAIDKSGSEILELNDDKSKIRRAADKPVVELSEEERKELNLRTVHFKGFPLDATEDSIREFAAKYGEIEKLELLKQKNDADKHRVSFATNDGILMLSYVFRELFL